MSYGRQAASAAGAAGAAAIFYSVFIEPYRIQTVEIEISAPRLPRSFDGYTILQISDLHTRRLGLRERLISDLIDELPTPDLAVVTGDMVHTPQGIPNFLRVVEPLRAKDGIFAIFGNSEHKNGIRPRAFAQMLAKAGIRTLLNEHEVIRRGADAIALIGVDDPVSLKDNMADALEGLDVDLFKLLLMHTPDGISEAVVRGVDLTLSGHTHGGQVKFPGIGAIFTHSLLGRGMSEGYYAGNRLKRVIGIRPGRSQLYVTRGLGVSGLAMRFLCRPELTRITLRRGFPRGIQRPVIRLKLVES